MKKTILTVIALLVLLGGAIMAYLYFQDEEQSEVEPVTIEKLDPPVLLPDKPEPEVRQKLNPPAEEIALPKLDSSDGFIASALEKLLSNKTLMSIFSNDQLIRNIVVTVDNLPRKKISMRLMPIKKAPGKFTPLKSEDGIVIDPENSTRYTSYVKFSEAADPAKIVDLYVQLYPLFQESYEELGYPNQYFNDRLITVLDHLLATPDIEEPVQLVQPKFFYLYADEDLESRSIGQRILMRIGRDNQQIIKAKLKAIKQTLLLHMHEEKISSTTDEASY